MDPSEKDMYQFKLLFRQCFQLVVFYIFHMQELKNGDIKFLESILYMSRYYSTSDPSASQLPNLGTLSHLLSAKPAIPKPSNADLRHSYFVNHTAYLYPLLSSQTDTPCV